MMSAILGLAAALGWLLVLLLVTDRGINRTVAKLQRELLQCYSGSEQAHRRLADKQNELIQELKAMIALYEVENLYYRSGDELRAWRELDEWRAKQKKRREEYGQEDAVPGDSPVADDQQPA